MDAIRQVGERFFAGTPPTRELLRVTDVLRGVGAIDTTWYTEAGRDRGTAVHEAVALDCEGALDTDVVRAHYPDIASRLEAWWAFKALPGLRVLAWEHRVVDLARGYTGRWDLLLEHPKLRYPDIVDLKCYKALPWVRLQLAAYVRASHKLEGIDGQPLDVTVEFPVLERASLSLLDDGTFRFDPLPRADGPGDERVFLSMLETEQWKRTHQPT